MPELVDGDVNLLGEFCVHTPRIGQDLSTWVEYDPQNELDHDCNDSWWQDVPNLRQDTALMKTVGGGGLGSDFFHEFTLNIFAVQKSGNGQTERICAWTGHLSMVVQDFYGSNDFEIASLVVMATDIDDEYQLKLIEKGGNEDTMATKWVNYQDRYMVIYKEGTKLIALAYQDAAHSILEDRAEIVLSGDLDFQYVSMPMAYGGPIAIETSSGYIDPVFGSFEQLLAGFEIRRSASVDLGNLHFDVGQGSEDLAGEFVVRHVGTPVNLPASFDGQVTEDLIATFDIHYRRIFGENWQRKSWFTDPYYWRSYYSLSLDSFVFEYIHKTGITGNVWTENVAARIDASGFDAAAIDADFSVRGPRNGLPITIVYSDGRDVWAAESDEASVLGWAWQNMTKVFDATAPDWYRRVGIFADRKTPTPGLYAVAVYYDDAPGAVQYVRFSEQTTPGDITGWDAAEDVSNTANTDDILGVAGRSMGATGALKKEVIVAYKEGIALRSRYHTSIGGWQAIQDIDTTAELEKSIACFDIEHYEITGDNIMCILYVDADNTVRVAKRPAGIAAVWQDFVTVDSSITEHDNVGIVDVGAIQFFMWQDGHNIAYRQHRGNPDTWWPALANPYNEFEPDTEAVVTTTSQPSQIQGPDDIAAGDAVVISWVGLIAGAAGKGWGILQAASVEALPGEFVVRHVGTPLNLHAAFEGQVTENLLGEFIVKNIGAEGLPAQFEVAQGDEDLFGEFFVLNVGSAELATAFDGQATLNIPAEFIIRRSNLLLLPAEFVVLQGWGDIPAEFFIWNAGSLELSAAFLIRYSDTVELSCEFIVQQETSVDLHAAFDAQASASLHGAFDVRESSSADLLVGFIVRHITPSTGIIIAVDPAAFFNYSENAGTGFLSSPTYSPDTQRKIMGHASLRSQIKYISKGYDYIPFGWKYRNPIRPKFVEDLPAEFVVRHSSDDLPTEEQPDLSAEFEVGQSAEDLPAKFFVLAGQAFNDLKGSFFAMPNYTSWTRVWTRDYGVGPVMDGIYVDDLGNCYMDDLINGSAYTRTRAGVETSTPDYHYAILRAGVVKAVSQGGIGYVVGENELIFMQFDINRYGAIVASINVATDNPDTNVWLAYHMSSNGKYIAFVVQGLTDNMYVMLYEGS